MVRRSFPVPVLLALARSKLLHDIKAIFVSTTTHEGSESQIGTLEVDPSSIYTSNTRLTVTGSPNNYNLIGTVTSLGGRQELFNCFDISNDDSEMNSTPFGPPS
jgi:hypothetical protein